MKLSIDTRSEYLTLFRYRSGWSCLKRWKRVLKYASRWSRNHSDRLITRHVTSQSSPEEGGAGGEDELVGLDLLLLTRDRHIKEVLLIPQLLERLANVPLEVVPLKTKFIPRPHVDTSEFRVTTTSAIDD